MKCVKLFAVAVCLTVLSACTTMTANQGGAASPQVQVYAIQSDYIAGVKMAQKYKDLKQCGAATTAVPICSSPDIVKKLQAADNVAYTSLVQAEDLVRTEGFGSDKVTTAMASARAAVDAFASLAKQYEVK